MALAILLTLVLIFLNGFFVAIEFALIGARHTRMEQLAKENNKSAKFGIGLMKDLPLAISGAQLGITVTSLGLGLVAEPAFASILEKMFDGVFEIPSAVAHWIAFGIAIFFVVFLHMVLGEMVPKNFALTDPEKIVCQLAATHRAFVFAFKPVIWFLNQTAALLLRPFGIKQVAEIGVAYTSQGMQDL
ncbi:MAG: CNNM domain-containing protein, partial [Actinomycetota bacterium]|nr:CNNM domain-containing protein [Actinomycetota bacterium]